MPSQAFMEQLMALVVSRGNSLPLSRASTACSTEPALTASGAWELSSKVPIDQTHTPPSDRCGTNTGDSR